MVPSYLIFNNNFHNTPFLLVYIFIYYYSPRCGAEVVVFFHFSLLLFVRNFPPSRFSFLPCDAEGGALSLLVPAGTLSIDIRPFPIVRMHCILLVCLLAGHFVCSVSAGNQYFRTHPRTRNLAGVVQGQNSDTKYLFHKAHGGNYQWAAWPP